MIDSKIFRECEVLSVKDDKAGLRIKVRLVPEDSDCLTVDELPYCYPLMPKHLHVNPKVGEMVLVSLSTLGQTKGKRWFYGPIISQQYGLGYDAYKYSARSILDKGKYVQPLPNPSLNPLNEGTLPDRDDIALQGRNNADVILKENEVRIRSGFKKNPNALPQDSLVFNDKDLAYIQMKYKKMKDGKGNDLSSVTNIVSDKINLLSHQSSDNFNLTDRKDLISDDELLKILENAHPMVYGDLLVSFLKQLVEIVRTHTHPFPMSPPCFTTPQIKVLNTDLDTLLSKNIKLS